MTKSIFLKKQGSIPKNKILDFLIVHQEFDYSLKDIAKFSEVGYTTLKKMKNDLVKDGWIMFTRKVGKAKMYKLNLRSQKVKKFIEFYWSVIDEELEEEKPKHYSGAPSAVPMSAQHI